MGSVSLPSFVAPAFNNAASFAEAAASGAFDETQVGWASSVFERKGLSDLAKLLNGVRNRRAIERFILRHEREVREALASAPWGAYRMKIDRHRPTHFGSLDLYAVAALLVPTKVRQEVQMTTGGLTAAPLRSVPRNGSGPHPPPHFATPADVKVLKMALELYQNWNGDLSTSRVIQGSLNGTELQGEISVSKVEQLLTGQIGTTRWLQLWKGFAVYFALEANQKSPRNRRAAKMVSQLLEHLMKKLGWNIKPKNAQKRLRYFAQRFVLLTFAGNIPGVGTPIRGVPSQGSSGRVMTRWIAGETIDLSKRLKPADFYYQVMALLVGLGRKKEEIDPLIRDAVFEGNGWNRNSKTAHDRLLLAVREVMAILHGGWSDDLSPKFMQWVKTGELPTEIDAATFYNPARSVLREGSVLEKEIEVLIQDFFFEKRGWKKRERTPHDRLLFQARRVFALRHHGTWPTISDGNLGLLASWLEGTISNPSELTLAIVTSFLSDSGSGMIASDEIDRLVAEARK